MSADNYYEVRIHPLGGFTYVMGFDSSKGETREPGFLDPRFNDVWAAYKDAANLSWPESAEGGVIFHPECEQALRDYWGPSSTPL